MEILKYFYNSSKSLYQSKKLILDCQATNLNISTVTPLYIAQLCNGLNIIVSEILAYFTDWEYYFPGIDDCDDTLERVVSCYPNSIGSDERLDFSIQMVSRITQRAIKSYEEVTANEESS